MAASPWSICPTIVEQTTADQVTKSTSLEGVWRPAPITCIRIGLLQKVGAGVHICERADAQAVGGVQLRLQEITAVLPNVHELQQAGCWEQHLEEKVTLRHHIPPAGPHLPEAHSNHTPPVLDSLLWLSTACPRQSKLPGLDFRAAPISFPTTLHVRTLRTSRVSVCVYEFPGGSY